jgi:two-component system phosphate regulon response regulator PhoB
VLKALSQMPDKRPRTLVLSGRSREQDITQAFEIGADDYMTKPFSPQELMARVTRLLR